MNAWRCLVVCVQHNHQGIDGYICRLFYVSHPHPCFFLFSISSFLTPSSLLLPYLDEDLHNGFLNSGSFVCVRCVRCVRCAVMVQLLSITIIYLFITYQQHNAFSYIHIPFYYHSPHYRHIHWPQILPGSSHQSPHPVRTYCLGECSTFGVNVNGMANIIVSMVGDVKAVNGGDSAKIGPKQTNNMRCGGGVSGVGGMLDITCNMVRSDGPHPQ